VNQFWLDDDEQTAAKFHQDAHVSKMPLEGGQMLCAAFEQPEDPAWLRMSPAARLAAGMLPYAWSNPNHPVSRWARATAGNFRKTAALALALLDEHSRRFRGEHATRAVVKWALANEAKATRLLSRSDLVMPFEVDVGDEDVKAVKAAEWLVNPASAAVAAYRSYYVREKQGHWRKNVKRRELVWVKASWTNCEPPPWWVWAPPPERPTAKQLVRLNLKTLDGWTVRRLPDESRA